MGKVSSAERPMGRAVRHPWYDDRLGRAMRTGFADVRTARPTDDVWSRIAAELGLPADVGDAAGLTTSGHGLAHRLERLRAGLAGPLARMASVGAMAAAVFVVALSLNVVLSGTTGGPFAWSSADLHQIGVPADEASIQPLPQNRAPADMSAARWWPDSLRAGPRTGTHAGSPLVLAPAFAIRPPARAVVPR